MLSNGHQRLHRHLHTKGQFTSFDVSHLHTRAVEHANHGHTFWMDSKGLKHTLKNLEVLGLKKDFAVYLKLAHKIGQSVH